MVEELLSPTALETTRLALLLYSNMLLFPLPACAGVARRLARELRGVLTRDKMRVGTGRGVWVLWPGLVLWALVLGGIGVGIGIREGGVHGEVEEVEEVEEEERKWFLEHARVVGSWVGLYGSWSELRRGLVGFMWVPGLMDGVGESFWREVYELESGATGEGSGGDSDVEE